MSILPSNEPHHCSTCIWGWGFDYTDEEDPKPFGQCHRHAPKPTAERMSHAIHWPVVRYADGCGEWSTRWTI